MASSGSRGTAGHETAAPCGVPDGPEEGSDGQVLRRGGRVRRPWRLHDQMGRRLGLRDRGAAQILFAIVAALMQNGDAAQLFVQGVVGLVFARIIKSIPTREPPRPKPEEPPTE